MRKGLFQPKIYLLLLIITLGTFASGWEQAAKIVAGDRFVSDAFGKAVAINDSFAVVGAYYEDHNVLGTDSLRNSGSAYFFKSSDGGASWSQVQKIVAPDRAADEWFGSSVAISNDYIVIGSPLSDLGDPVKADAGAAYVFPIGRNIADSEDSVLSGVKLTGSYYQASDAFGTSVAVSGSSILVGATAHIYDETDANGVNGGGAVYAFKTDDNGVSWSDPQKIVIDAADRKANDKFGVSVAMSGNLAVAGAYQYNNMTEGGKAYILKTVDGGTSWSVGTKLVSPDISPGDQFGYSVDIDGDRVIVGAPWEDEDVDGLNNLYNAGSAYIFTTSDGGDSWSSGFKVVSENRVSNNYFGDKVAISGDQIAVASYKGDSHGNVTLYSTSDDGTSWDFNSVVAANVPLSNDYFGGSLCMFGNSLMVGAINEDENENNLVTISNSGSVYFFQYPTNTPPALEVSIDDITVTEDSPDINHVDLNDIFSDNGAITFTVTSDNSALVTPSISESDSILTLSITADTSGTAEVTVVATDEQGETVSDAFIVTVTPENDAPTIISNGDTTTNEDESITIIKDMFTINDVETSIENLQFTVLAGTNYTVIDGVVTPTANYNGNLTVNVEISDGDLSGNATITVSVLPKNDSPVMITKAMPEHTDEDIPITLTVDMTDAYDIDGDILTLILVDGDNYSVSDVSTLVPDQDYFGSIKANVRVTDGTDTSLVKQMNISVNAINDKPKIHGLKSGETSISESGNVVISLDMFDYEDVDGDPLTLIVGEGDGYTLQVEAFVSGLARSVVSADALTEQILLIPNDGFVGNLTVPIILTDGIDSTAVPFDLSINYAEPVAISELSTPKNINSKDLIFAPNPVPSGATEVFFVTPTMLTGEWEVTIYDNLGNVIDFQSFNSDGGYTYSWDLRNKNGQKVSAGMYVAIITVESSNGTIEMFKRVIGVKQ
jgi:hypothetical protein